MLGDIFGWRGVFFVLAGFLAIAAVGLFSTNCLDESGNAAARRRRGPRAADLSPRTRFVLASTRWARFIILAGFIEYSLVFGAFAYIGADLRARFGLSFTLIGVIIGMFAAGGLIYAAFVKQFVARFGQVGLAGCRRRTDRPGVSDASRQRKHGGRRR